VYIFSHSRPNDGPTGLALVAELCRCDNATVFATVRDPSTASDLQAMAKESGGALHIIKLALGNEGDLNAAVKEIQEIAGKIDVVIANAGA
jgi:NAD(P)-dependent dehydrogenase (short-subunit alcohol dehydrogenase family)